MDSPTCAASCSDGGRMRFGNAGVIDSLLRSSQPFFAAKRGGLHRYPILILVLQIF